jgi:hypothetical protein
MPPLTRDQLAFRRSVRRREQRRHHRRLAYSIGSVVLLAGILALALGLSRGGHGASSVLADEPADAAAPPMAVAALSAPAPPPPLGIATLGSLSLRMPVDRRVVTAIAFRAVDNPAALALTPAKGTGAEVISGGGSGPDTGSVDIGAPAGTLVWSPVDGTVASVAPYLIAGRPQGYEVTIQPSVAAGILVRMTHLQVPSGGRRPRVGQAVRAGTGRPIGQVRDFTSLGRQMISRFTPDGGNHVHIEVVRTGGSGLP